MSGPACAALLACKSTRMGKNKKKKTAAPPWPGLGKRGSPFFVRRQLRKLPAQARLAGATAGRVGRKPTSRLLGVEYCPAVSPVQPPAAPSPQKKKSHGGKHDLAVRQAIITAYRQAKEAAAAAGRNLTVADEEGQRICRQIGAVVFPAQQSTRNQRTIAAKQVRRWAARFDKDPTLDSTKNAPGAGGATAKHKHPPISPAGQQLVRKTIKKKKF